MASSKDFRNKPISDMSVDELKKFIKDVQGAGIKGSKEVDKAINLLKVLTPDKYGSKTVEDAKKKLLISTTPETQARLGIGGSSSSGLSGMGFSGSGTGTIDLNKMYDDLMNSPELKALNEELIAKKKAKDEANANINDNPFYSEATRVGKIAKLDEKANDEINTLQYQIDQKKADAQVRLSIATQQYNIESQAYQQNLQKLNMLITSGALLNASGSDISQIAVATGMSTGMVNGIITKMKADAIKPELFTDAQTGKVTAIDPATGKILYSTQVSTPKPDTSGAAADAKQEAAFNAAIKTGIDQLKSGEGWDVVFDRIKSQFRNTMPDAVLFQLIDKGLGGAWNASTNTGTGWAASGAYEEYKKKTAGASGQTINIINPGSN
jgi:hypothetical protein